MSAPTARARVIPTAPIGYVEFIAPGILAQSVLFVAIFYGVSLIWERDLGIMHKYLVIPAPRAALVLGLLRDITVQVLALLVLTGVATRLYPRIVD